jgi:hypothetical protein
MKPCALCGEPILPDPSDPDETGTAEHVPPQQFFPKALRSQLREPLWTVPSHRKCNQKHKLDEEYFFQYMYALVAVQNEQMGTSLLEEIRRRAKKPQARGLIRRMIKECTLTSPGGIILPPPLIRVNCDTVRIQNVVLKIAQCLFYKDHDRHMPRSGCVHIQMCQDVPDLEPPFDDLFRVQEVEKKSAAPDVFRYWSVDLDGLHAYALLFWNAFMFCLFLKDPTMPETRPACGGEQEAT